MVECLTRDRGAVGSSLTGVTSCVLEQDTLILAEHWFNPGSTHSYITERLLMGRKKSNQTKTNLQRKKYNIIWKF